MEKLEMLPNRPENAALNSIAEKVNALIDGMEATKSFFVDRHNELVEEIGRVANALATPLVPAPLCVPNARLIAESSTDPFVHT